MGHVVWGTSCEARGVEYVHGVIHVVWGTLCEARAWCGVRGLCTYERLGSTLSYGHVME